MTEKAIVFVDDGFLAKLSKYFGGGAYIKFDKVMFCKNIVKKQNLECEKIFYYTAPPFQSDKPTREESARYRNYKRFVDALSKDKQVIVREGGCQRLKIDNTFIYKQKAVDSLAIIDMMSVPLDYPSIKQIILIASDSDFVPIIEKLKNIGIIVIVYTYFVKKRDTGLSRSNFLLRAASKYARLSKQDLLDAPLIAKEKPKKENAQNQP